jgi:hypothetical protein
VYQLNYFRYKRLTKDLITLSGKDLYKEEMTKLLVKASGEDYAVIGIFFGTQSSVEQSLRNADLT